MALALIGDIHGNFPVLARLVAGLPDDVIPIQVGDFGYWPQLRQSYVPPKHPVHWINGNHDHVVDAPHCDWPNAIFVPRGEVRVLAGYKVLFVGGSTSVDGLWRVRAGLNYQMAHVPVNAWFHEEEVLQSEDVERAIANVAKACGVDLMVTHTPPDWMIRKHFGPEGLRSFGIDPKTWRDRSAERVELLWRTLGEPPLFSGHMHESVTDGNCRILAENEVCIWPEPVTKESVHAK